MAHSTASSIDGIRRALSRLSPVHVLALGYASYILIVFALLNLPWLHRLPDLSAMDHLFMATSAVSTTGLITLNTPEAYNAAGQLVLLLGFQLGGIGYMTAGSVLLLATDHKLSKYRLSIGRAVFALPAGMDFRSFVIRAAGFTLAVEALGAAALTWVFWNTGVEHPLWAGIFHSVSAFCTAGFSVFPDSLAQFEDSSLVTVIVSALSLSGALGFIVVYDLAASVKARRLQATLTTRIIVVATLGSLLVGWVTLLSDPVFQSSTSPVNAAFFQAMTSLTTVGFNTVDFGALSPASVSVVIVLMILGASPSGTGGGLKSTSWSAALGAIWSLVRGRDCVAFWGARIPNHRLIAAFASMALYLAIFALGSILLQQTETAPFEDVLFEAASALGTVGISRGITADLSEAGKLIIICLMYIGRIGVLSLALSAAAQLTGEEQLRDDDLAV